MNKPRFIQITSAGLQNNSGTQCDWLLYALDTEGRIWEKDNRSGWREVPLPQVTKEGERT